MTGAASGRASGTSAERSEGVGTSGSIWGVLAREGLNLCAIALAEGRHHWADRAARRWAWERRRLGAQLLRGGLALLLVWTALMLGLASALLVIDPLWWPAVLACASAACVLSAFGLLRWGSGERQDQGTPRNGPS